jgi:hypothetical protein
MPAEMEEDSGFMSDARKEVRRYLRPSEPVKFKFECPDVRKIYLPSEPTKEEWKHNPNAETMPGWAVPLLVLLIIGLTAILIRAHAFAPIIK